MNFFTACKAGVSGGAARCRNQEGSCSSHPATKQSAPAPRPTVILLKFNLSDLWQGLFLKAGVQIEQRNYGKRRQLEGKHTIQAESLGRDAYKARPQLGELAPESADSGCPVFGKDGLSKMGVDVRSLIDEIRDAGFVLSRTSVLQREHKRAVLVTEWTREIKAEVVFPEELFSRFVNALFEQVHVWANPREAGGKVVHTVNCNARTDNAPSQNTLHFANGDWDVKPVVAAVEESFISHRPAAVMI